MFKQIDIGLKKYVDWANKKRWNYSQYLPSSISDVMLMAFISFLLYKFFPPIMSQVNTWLGI